jgi:hypothetical protein
MAAWHSRVLQLASGLLAGKAVKADQPFQMLAVEVRKRTFQIARDFQDGPGPGTMVLERKGFPDVPLDRPGQFFDLAPGATYYVLIIKGAGAEWKHQVRIQEKQNPDVFGVFAISGLFGGLQVAPVPAYNPAFWNDAAPEGRRPGLYIGVGGGFARR